MNQIEYIISEEIRQAFMNLAYVDTAKGRTGRRFAVGALMHLMEQLIPELKRIGAISADFGIPAPGCQQCAEEFLKGGAHPIFESGFFACIHRQQRDAEWRNCPIRSILELPTKRENKTQEKNSHVQETGKGFPGRHGR